MAMQQGQCQPAESEVVISVSQQHAVVSCCEPRTDGAIICRRAINAEELEREAISAVASSNLPFLIGTQYPCPPQLAVRARWN